MKDRVRYQRPQRSGIVDGTLGEALNDWIHYLRTGVVARGSGGEVRVRSRHDVLVEIELRGTHRSKLHGVVDSGFGYSQVLPILVKLLLAQPGSTVLIEQPEVHLNPALQVRLAEFLAAAVAARKQVVVETHSEHIVNSLRTLIAESRSELAEQLRIYYLEAGPGGLPVVHDLEVRRDGTVPDWPSSFFGEPIRLTSRLLAAQQQTRKH
jgi:predicted ATPase